MQQDYISQKKENFLHTDAPRALFIVNALMALLYLYVMAFWFPRGNIYLFAILIIGQIYHSWQVISYLFTIWNTGYMPKRDDMYKPPVDVFITVAGEPVEIVEETVVAALAMDYPQFRVYVLNDGFVAKKDNWLDIENMARQVGVHCITRTVPGGAKAGNINHALSVTSNPFVAIFDADHVPHKNFLQEMMAYSHDRKVGFIQSPQYYKNNTLNYLTGGAWEQQGLFFGPICKGKNRLNSVTMCGTNMVFRRNAIEQVGGMCDSNIAEDFVTGLFLHEKGWKSVYVPKVLAEGLAPEDFLSYYKQQFRWSRGSLEVVLRFNPFFRRGLSFAQRIQYLTSASYYLSGIVVFLYALIPIIFLYTGLVPFKTSTMELAVVFLPYIFLTIYALQRSSSFSYSFRALAFSMGSFPIHINAFIAALFKQKNNFAVTSKKALTGNFVQFVIPHIVYIALTFIGIGVGLGREGLSASLATNMAWALFNVAVFMPFVKAATPNLGWAKGDRFELNVRKPVLGVSGGK